MKRCSSCRRTYADDTLAYCLEDGSALEAFDAAAPDLPATLIMHDPRPTAPAGVETFRPSAPPAAQPQQPQAFAAPQPSPWPQALGPLSPVASLAVPGQGRGAAVASLVCAIAAFALLGFCFIAGASGVDNTVVGGTFLFSAFLGLAGAVVGIVAVAKAGKDTGPHNSKSMAVVGLVLSGVYLLLTLFFLVLGALASPD